MRFIQTTSKEKSSPPHPEKNKTSLALTCIGMSLIFLLAVAMSGCVVHSNGHHGRGHGKGHHKGHHKGHLKIKPKIGISVSPMIVIDD